MTKTYFLFGFLFLLSLSFESKSQTDEIIHPFNCSVKNNNSGCLKEVKCPVGYSATKARITCNLESKDHFPELISQQPWGQLTVIRESDVSHEGKCEVKGLASISSGSANFSLNKNPAYSDFEVYCTEKDDYSGADCSIAGDVVCRKYNGPIFENKLKFRTFRPVQGIVKLGESNWIATQDFNKAAEKSLRFSLLNPWGDVVRDWDIPYEGHGQSLYIRPSAEGGYDIFTEAKSGVSGFARLHLDPGLQKLTFIKEIPLTKNGEPFPFTVFSVYEETNKVAFFQKDETGKFVKFADLDQALAGIAENTSIFTVKGALGSLQGIALSKDRVFVLFGDAYIYDPKDSTKFLVKSIMWYSYDGKIAEKYVITEGRNHAISEGVRYEPEGIQYLNDALYFNMFTDKTNRFYRAPANFIPVPE